MEDVIRLSEDDLVIVLFRNDDALLRTGKYVSKPVTAAIQQHDQGIASNLVKLHGKSFICLRAAVQRTDLHHNIKHGNMTKAEFKR